ncbi:glycosyl transferase [Rugosimonospora acidiphila]|uniref:Glycosyl transferase n=1 Tax=Rugosimonospora acidiphila TaxID=556531 RepID=A0ABP9RRX2_9ACTN
MTALVEEAADSSAPAPRPAAARRPTGRRYDLAVLAACVAGALYLTWQLWVDPNQRVVLHNRGDQALFEWLLTYAAHSLTHLNNPFWTTLLNVPIGVNLAVNTSMVVVGGLVAPITLTLGASVAFLVVLTLNLILTPFAWYYVLSRHITRTRAAAVLGGLFCGFAPGMVSHANAHLNFTGQFLVPFIVLCVLRLGGGRHPVRGGVLLGVLVVLEFSIGAEMLFFVALGLALFVALWAWMRRSAARAQAPNFVRGLVAAGVVSLVLLAYPLYMEFAGPQRYHGIGFDQRVHSENLASYVAVPYLSLARLAGLWHSLAPNFTEETTFFGPLLVILAVVCVVVMWRRPVVRAMGITALVLAVLALGPRLHIGSWSPPVPLPYAALIHLPIFNSALPARVDLVLIPIIGLLLAFALDRALTLTPRRRNTWIAGFTVALLPIVPLPIPAAQRDPVPAFFTDGTYRQYIHSGQTLVPVPPPSDLLPNGQRWQTATNFGFAIPAGFFLGPGGPDGRSRIGPVPRPTYDTLSTIALTGAQLQLTSLDELHAKQDLAYWHAKLIVMSTPGPGDKWAPNAGKLLAAATTLFGPPQKVDDVWLWKVP